MKKYPRLTWLLVLLLLLSPVVASCQRAKSPAASPGTVSLTLSRELVPVGEAPQPLEEINLLTTPRALVVKAEADGKSAVKAFELPAAPRPIPAIFLSLDGQPWTGEVITSTNKVQTLTLAASTDFGAVTKSLTIAAAAPVATAVLITSGLAVTASAPATLTTAATVTETKTYTPTIPGWVPNTPSQIQAAGAKAGGTYEIKSGDTVGAIAQAMGVSVEAIMQANGLQYSTNAHGQRVVYIFPGQTLENPAVSQILTIPGAVPVAPAALGKDRTGYTPGDPWNWTAGYASWAVRETHQRGQRTFFVTRIHPLLAPGPFADSQQRVYMRDMRVGEEFWVRWFAAGADGTSDYRWVYGRDGAGQWGFFPAQYLSETPVT